ncbi:MAG TPA: monofunctional biosynthetic peptidoglycan transglycosylase [Thermoanaerobaculia bacterium]|jgi:monofunctional biosynthetic peptidoglycan transglycosylase|nr:monofunctional biosynthetic peptidoglycan transglycosylase [Thermoanaerobaculia bacterium]
MAESIAPPYDVPRRGRRRRLLLALLVLFGVYVAWEALTWPDVAALDHAHPETTAFMEKYRGWGIFGPKREVEQKWVPYSRISSNLKRAVIVSEDIRFFSHEGFDEKEIRAALEDAWEDKELPRGASTLTQQLAKNLWLSASYNPLRKVKEAVLTRQLEKELSKRRILELYLNVAEFGRGIYGAEAAARHYYGKSARSLTERQAAELAASLPRPRSWHPGVKSRGYQRKVRAIQRRMARARWLRGEI